ncbi:MAG: hypothetical protein HYZ45_01015 [Burkholderiales bacterium]|nr:hypothetical protein [Burkholderiales bacterium]
MPTDISTLAPRIFCAAALSLASVVALNGCERGNANTAVNATNTANSASSSSSATEPSRAALKAAHDEQYRLEQQLMRSAFGKKFDAKKGVAIAELTEVEDRSSKSRYQISPVQSYALPNKEMLLVANAQALNNEDQAESFHLTPGLLNLFWFKKSGKTWALTHKAENIDTLGTNGSFGAVKFQPFGDGQTMMGVESGGTWQGYTITFVNFFQIKGHSVQSYGPIKLFSGNDGACDDETDRCWNIEGKWKLAEKGGDNDGGKIPNLIVHFSGTDEERPTSHGKAAKDKPNTARKLKKIEQTAVYQIKGGKYELVKGENPVPEF